MTFKLKTKDNEHVHLFIPTWLAGTIITLLGLLVSGIITVTVFVVTINNTFSENAKEHLEINKRLDLNDAEHKGIVNAFYEKENINLYKYTDPYTEKIDEAYLSIGIKASKTKE